MLLNLISETLGPARPRSFGLVAAIVIGAALVACAGSSGGITGSAAGDPGRPRAESIGGTVWTDGDGDGQYSPGEATSVGTTVTLWQGDNGFSQCSTSGVQVGSTVTGEDGTYLFESLPDGSYCVQAGTGATATWTGPVQVTAGTGHTLNIAVP